jgi:hypothetical protein
MSPNVLANVTAKSGSVSLTTSVKTLMNALVRATTVNQTKHAPTFPAVTSASTMTALALLVSTLVTQTRVAFHHTPSVVMTANALLVIMERAKRQRTEQWRQLVS